MPVSAFVSAPAQKPRPAPVTTTTRTSGSSSASAREARYSSSILAVQALSRSGRLRVIRATPRSTSYNVTLRSTAPVLHRRRGTPPVAACVPHPVRGKRQRRARRRAERSASDAERGRLRGAAGVAGDELVDEQRQHGTDDGPD